MKVNLGVTEIKQTAEPHGPVYFINEVSLRLRVAAWWADGGHVTRDGGRLHLFQFNGSSFSSTLRLLMPRTPNEELLSDDWLPGNRAIMGH